MRSRVGWVRRERTARDGERTAYPEIRGHDTYLVANVRFLARNQGLLLAHERLRPFCASPQRKSDQALPYGLHWPIGPGTIGVVMLCERALGETAVNTHRPVPLSVVA